MSEAAGQSLLRPAALTEFSRLMHSALGPAELLRLAVEEICRLYAAEMVVLVLSPDRVWPAAQIYSACSAAGADLPGFAEEIAGGRLHLQALRATGPQVLLGNELRELLPPTLAPRLESWLAAPLTWRSGEPLGALHLLNNACRGQTEDCLAVAEQLASGLALAIENDRLAGAEQAARQAAETLRMASLALTQELNLEAALETLLDYLIWVVPYDGAGVILVEGSQARLHAYRGYDPQSGAAVELDRSPFFIENETLISEMLTDQEAVAISDTRRRPVTGYPISPTVLSWMGVPLVSDGKTVGLCILERATPAAFSEDQQRMTRALAAQTVVTIKNARLFAALSKSEERYRAATELASDYAYSLRVQPDGKFALDWVTDAFQRMTGFQPVPGVQHLGWLVKPLAEDQGIVMEHVQTLLAGHPCTSEFRIFDHSGQVRWLREYSRPLKDESGDQVAMIYGAARDITQRRHRESELAAVADTASAMRMAAEQSEMLPVILDETMKILSAQGAALALFDSGGHDIVIERGDGDWHDWGGLRMSKNEGLTGYVCSTGQAYSSTNALSEPHRSPKEALRDLNAVICLPLIDRQKTIGALWAGRSLPFEANAVRLLSAIADIAANAIRRANLHEQTERRLQNLTALRSIDRAITASLDLRVTLEILLDHVTSQLGVHAADILLLDPITQTLNYNAGRGFRSFAVTRSQLRLGEGYAGRAAQERRTIQVQIRAGGELDTLRFSTLIGEGFQIYYCVPLVAKGQIKGVMEIFHREALHTDVEWLDLLETLAGQAAIAVENAQLFESLQQSNLKLTMAYDATIEGWSRALELRDKETQGHSERVTEITLRLSRSLGMGEAELVDVRRGALLHDIGKMGIPDHILLKAGPLSDEEWQIMRQHPVYAYQMLLPISYLRAALDIPYCHHERWNGSGYPRGMKGDEIPLSARIFAVVDVWDALSSDRPYGKAWQREKVRDYLRAQAGELFDVRVVETFLKLEI